MSEERRADYVFDQAWEQERRRLGSLSALCDPITRRRLEALRLGPGWRCLEIGGGAGSLAAWIGSRIGPSGRLVVTDLDIRFLEELRSNTVEVRRHDIVIDELEKEAYDLVHARAVLQHLPGWRQALDRMVQALRPGGWLLVEDVLFGGAMQTGLEAFVRPPESGPLITKLLNGGARVFSLVGSDAMFGPKLLPVMLSLGLEEVDAELTSRLVQGGSDALALYQLSADELGPKLVGMGLMGDDELARARTVCRDPSTYLMSAELFGIWGRRQMAGVAGGG
jgi:SAM-dependent methyltransferase